VAPFRDSGALGGGWRVGPFGSFIEYAMLNDAVSQLHAKFIDTPVT
jgi:hypothetical protein